MISSLGAIAPNFPVLVGTQAVAAYELFTGKDESGVPVETGGGSGTAGSHWLESTFKNELMTGYLNGVPGQLSSITGGSLADLGYVMNQDRKSTRLNSSH